MWLIFDVSQKKMKCVALLFISALTVLTGCASSDAFVSKAVRRSKAYADMMARSSHTTFVIEEKHADHAIVALGEMPESELKRFYTLRVSSTGGVERRFVDMHGGITWIPDR